MFKIRFPFLILSRKRFEKEVATQAMEACEQIISEMGAEVHDVLTEKLTGLRLQLDKIERFSFDALETKTLIDRMQNDFEGIDDSIRKISKQLRQAGEQGESFEKGVRRLCESMESYGASRLHPSFRGTARPLSAMAETYLRRMIQELVHNALRHSYAWHVWIRVDWQPDAVVIEVEDDGSGFAKLSQFISLLKGKHNTLRMRAESIGATLEYKHGKKGLLATVRLPYQQ